MTRGWARLLILPALLSLGCEDALVVRPYAGTIIQMAWSGAPVSAAGTHLELWVRDQNDSIIRVDGSYTFRDAKGNTKVIYPLGMMIRAAISFDDPCMIDSKGNLLVSADAYPRDVVISGTRQTPEQQAQIVQNRIAQVTAMNVGGRQANTLLAVIPADETARPSFTTTPSAAERLAACKAYWDASPLSYTPNPAQLTAPLHGTVYGFISYTTVSPAAGYDGIRIDSPTKLKGLRELFLTVENVPVANVDAKNRGPVFLQGFPSQGGQEVVHIDLTGPNAGGTAALLVDLDDTSIVF